jgi:hypothetical protein
MTQHSGWLALSLAVGLGCPGDEDPGTEPTEVRIEPKRRARVEGEQGKVPENLKSLGYVDGLPDPHLEQRGVLVHQRDKVYEGVNFYASRNQSRAQLLDMNGTVLHVWELPGNDWWQHCELMPDGDLVVIIKDQKVFRIDKDSKVEWMRDLDAHHDLSVDSNGDLYVLARRHLDGRSHHHALPTVEDYVVVLSPEGEPKREISILGVLERSPYAFLLSDSRALPSAKVYRSNPEPNEQYDILHTNHVEVFDGSLARQHAMFSEGNLLVSPRNIHAVMIIDPRTEQIVWLWGPSNLIYPHHPTLTRDGHILIFNNGTEKTRSQIVEVDPKTNDVVWTYQGEFYSMERGSNQRLPNGNTLVTESDPGYVFEVTREGEMVWQFANPHIFAGKNIRMSIWRMTRYPREAVKFELNGGTTR